MKRLLTLFVFLPFVLCICSFSAAVNLNQTYTLDEDFDSGTMAGLEHETIHDQLQISNPPTTIPFIWIPNSNEGTVSKVDTRNGKELGRYRVSPFPYSSPSRTTVDLEGDCWVGNRQTGTVVKIGLYENGGYIDRNSNGIIETSLDLNNDSVITGNELLDWGLDECVLYDIILIPGKEGTYAPGQYKGSYANDSSNPGPRGLAVDAQNNIWAGTFATMKFYYIDGSSGQIIRTVDVSSVNHKCYGALIDENGIIWSSGCDNNHVLRLDPLDNSFYKINIPHYVYGLGIDRQNHLFVSGWTDSKFTRINTLTGVIEWTKDCPVQSRGIITTDDGDIWIANSFGGTVSRYSSEGILKATINVGSIPTGLSMDADGKVWVVNNGDEYIHRINPVTNSIELSKRIPGGLHYGYSDMNGAISRTITTKIGTWIVKQDSEMNNTPWGFVSWNSNLESDENQNTRVQSFSNEIDASLNVKVRSSNDGVNWSTWEETLNGIKLSSTPPGRYLEVWTNFQILSGSESPILYDLAIKADIADLSVTMTDNPDPISYGEELIYTLNVSNAGPSYADNVIIRDLFPPQLHNFQASIDNGESWWDWDGTVNIGAIMANDSMVFLIKGKLNQSISVDSITNTVTVISDTMDLNTLNNIFRESTSIINKSDLAIQINTSNTSPHIGNNVKITLIVKNNGPDNATGVKTTYQIPNGLKFTSSNSYNPLTSFWNIGNLESGSTISLEIFCKVENDGLINNTATVSANQIDPNTANNKANMVLRAYLNPSNPILPSGSIGDIFSTVFNDIIGNHAGNGYNGNHYGDLGKIIPALEIGSGSSAFMGPVFNPYGKTPSQILNHYLGEYIPAGIKNNPLILDLIVWMHGTNPLLFPLTSFNPFSFYNYEDNKLVDAAKKAMETGDIWDFLDYPFYHFYGYENLDNMWGGGNLKWFLENFVGLDTKGNMSVGYFLLNLATLIPIALVASIVGKILIRFLPKAGVYVLKSPILQFLLKNNAVQMILKVNKNYLVDPISKLVQPFLQRFSRFKIPSLTDIAKRIIKISDLININPKTWIETVGKKLSEYSWVYNNIKQLEIKIYDNLKLWGKILPEEIPTIISDVIKTSLYGAKGGFGSLLSIFSDMTPLAVKEWVHTSPWRMRTFSGLTKLTSTRLYKDVHGVVSPLIKKNLALHSVYKAAKKVNETVKKIPQVVKKVVKTATNKIKTAVKVAKKVTKKIISKVTKTAKKVVKTVKKAVKKAGTTIKKAAKKVVKTAKKIVKKATTTVKKVVKKVSKAVNKTVKTAKNAISSGINWLKGTISWR